MEYSYNILNMIANRRDKKKKNCK